jgi:4-methyl-5(b-hydroxyethyl)-thiazole monophosphate biosynthesis
MDKVYVFLADGFEEIEGLTVVDLLRRAQIDTAMVSITGQKRVTGSHGIVIEADLLFEELKEQEGTAFVLPGGMPGTRYLAAHEGLAGVLTRAAAQGKLVAAICAAPSVLGGLGLLNGHKAVCYPGFGDQLIGAEVTGHAVEVSGNIITSRGMGTAIEFALTLVAQMKDQQTADDLGKAIIWGIS